MAKNRANLAVNVTTTRRHPAIAGSSRLSLRLVVAGMWLLFIHEALKSLSMIQMYVGYSGFFLLFIALGIQIKNNALAYLYPKYRVWLTAIWTFGFFALLYGFVRSNSFQFISRDVWPYSLFACLLAATRLDWWSALDRMIYGQFVVGLAIFVYAFTTTDLGTIERGVILANEQASNAPKVYAAWGLLYGWQFMLLTFSRKQPLLRKVVTICGVSLFVIFGLIMLKRQVVVEFLSLLIIRALIEARVGERRNRLPLLVFCAGAAIIASLSLYVTEQMAKQENVSYLAKLGSRFYGEGSLLRTTLTDDRLYDTPRQIYQNARPVEVLLGQGLGSIVVRDGLPANAVESGFFTVFMKGGLIMVAIWYAGLGSIMWEALFVRRTDSAMFSVLSCVFIPFTLVFPFFLAHFGSGYQMLWLGRVVSHPQNPGRFRHGASVSRRLTRGENEQVFARMVHGDKSLSAQ